MTTYTQPHLPYSTDALEPVIGVSTIEYHYGKHTRAYIDNLNNLIKDTEFKNMDIVDVIKHGQGALFNNASQAWNHIFYFFSFAPDCGGRPEGELADAINRDFGSFEEFKKLFEETGERLFGSGWVWLSCDDYGRLHITSGSNAANPLTQGLTPLLCFDLWEHAYYLDYQNRRAEHLHRLWDIIDWSIIGERYDE